MDEKTGTIFHNMRLFDGLSPRLLEDRIVAVRGGRIAAVDDIRNLPAYSGCERIDLEGATLLPGLIDMHVQIGVPFIRRITLRAVRDLHPQIRRNFRWCLESGVTTVRDMAGIPGILRKYKDLTARGAIPGPRVFCAHSFITCPGGYPDMAPHFNPIQRWMVGGQFAERLRTPAEVRDCVRRMVDLGADWIKTGHAERSYFAGRPEPLPNLPDECYRALVDEAHRLDRPVAFHQTFVSSMRKGVEMDVDTLEHIPSEPIPEDLIDEIVRKGIAVIPTFRAPAAYVYLEESARWLEENGSRYFEPEPLRQTKRLMDLLLKKTHTPEELARDPLVDVEMIRHWWDRSPSLFDNARRLHEAGVVMGCGSDAGGEVVFFGNIHRELEFMTRAGLSRFEALQAGTITSARILRRDDVIGSIEPGKLADMIVVRGNPLETLDALADVAMVVKDGRIFKLRTDDTRRYVKSPAASVGWNSSVGRFSRHCVDSSPGSTSIVILPLNASLFSSTVETGNVQIHLNDG